MMRAVGFSAALCVAGVVGAAAQTVCPAGVAHDGVWLSFPDRSVLAHVLSDGRTQEIEFAADGSYIYGARALALGLIVEGWGLENGRVPAGDRETVSYVGNPDPMPAPVDGAQFDGIEIASFDGAEETRATINLTVGTARDVAIGPCRYTGLPIDVTRIDLDDGLVMRDAMMHLPELGLTIFVGFAEGEALPERVLPDAISLSPPGPFGAPEPEK